MSIIERLQAQIRLVQNQIRAERIAEAVIGLEPWLNQPDINEEDCDFVLWELELADQ